MAYVGVNHMVGTMMGDIIRSAACFRIVMWKKNPFSKMDSIIPLYNGPIWRSNGGGELMWSLHDMTGPKGQQLTLI